ncbi:MAG: hypothetical protein IZT60_08965 [Gammaproteobacteria bacterium]|nr:hypothetical protein [Gammaproteobacteria bacterium]
MELNVVIDEDIFTLNVPDQLLQQAGSFFDKMDADMDQGIQLSRQWVENPQLVQRLQLVGNKLLTALETEDHQLGRMMAAYMLSRAPDIDRVYLDTTGEIDNSEIQFKNTGVEPTFGIPMMQEQSGQQTELRDRAEKMVSSVFKQGRLYHFSILDPETQEWATGAAVKEQQQAETLREQAVQKKMRELE